jgi:hypothetical protein
VDNTDFKFGVWVEKLFMEIQEGEDGACLLVVHWNEKDPELQAWTELTDEKREQLLLEALLRGLEKENEAE